MADDEMNEMNAINTNETQQVNSTESQEENTTQTQSTESEQVVTNHLQQQATQTIEEIVRTPSQPVAQTPPTQITQEEEHPIRHIQPASHKETASRLLQQAGLHTLLWLQFLWTVLCRVTEATQSVSVSVLRGFQGRVYVFFQGSTHPYRLQDYTIAGPGVPAVEWYYNFDKKLFMSSNTYNTTSEINSHHFEWLSGEIKYNNLLLHDISEYLQEAKWAGAARPSAAVILSAWSLHSGIILHLSEGIQLHTINQDATESVLSTRG